VISVLCRFGGGGLSVVFCLEGLKDVGFGDCPLGACEVFWLYVS
jgi:hypothetical protein